MPEEGGIVSRPLMQYRNFVKARREGINQPSLDTAHTKLSGLEVKKLYLEEVIEVKTDFESTQQRDICSDDAIEFNNHPVSCSFDNDVISNRELFNAAQSDDVHKVRNALSACGDRKNILDEYGWSLLMIACQANSINTVKELLKRGANLSIRDKAGNSARSLVIKNKNCTLATLFLEKHETESVKPRNRDKKRLDTGYHCETCGRSFRNKEQHITSTLHNLNVSKGRKIPALYKIPETNKGFQIMLKSGWDKNIGLGASGSGMRYPIKCVPKKNRVGLGNSKSIKQDSVEEKGAKERSKIRKNDIIRDKILEVNFRREFY